MTQQDFFLYVFLLVGIITSIALHKLTVMGALIGGVVGLLIFKGAGITGICMLTVFFIAATTATSWQLSKKQALKIAEKNKGRRTSGQVLANGGIAAVVGGLGWWFPEYVILFRLMLAGSLASATADTLSSELGSIYGSRFYDVLSFKRTQRGANGVISLEGTIIGIFGSALIAIIFEIGFGFDHSLWIIIIAGTVGNLFDSILGATFERKQLLGNNIVNFLNTCAGAGVCMLLYSFF